MAGLPISASRNSSPLSLARSQQSTNSTLSVSLFPKWEFSLVNLIHMIFIISSIFIERLEWKGTPLANPGEETVAHGGEVTHPRAYSQWDLGWH